MTQYMVLFSLGPVQSFIAQARKTRDLWLGSYLLSTLMEAGMDGINPDAFVFPANRTLDGYIPDIPNKYIAIFNNREDAENAAIHSISKIKAYWERICKEVYHKIIEAHATDNTREIWQRQTNPENFFEFFWVVVEGDPDNYKDWLSRSQTALDARKRLRNFLPQDEPGEKSTTSGERQALRGEGTSRYDVRKFWSAITSQNFISSRDIYKEGAERLDAIDTIKRFALYSSTLKANLEGIDFPSTSSFATASFVSKLLHEVLQLPMTDANRNSLNKWRSATDILANSLPNAIKAIPFLEAKAGTQYKWILQRDGDCYFPDTFTPRFLKENYSKETKGKEDIIKGLISRNVEAQRELLQAFNLRPTPYYAIVQMDGDKMGTIINQVTKREAHKRISESLSQFAREKAPSIVQENHPGRLVYAGGDDVLAFTPLDGMLEMVEELQKRYKETVGNSVQNIEGDQKVTASIGIAIAHHLTPLSIVIRAAREAEKLAKDRYGRNALVITIIRHSGEQTRVGCHWNYDGDPEIEPLKLFKKFRGYFAKDILSPKCIHTLLSEAPTLIDLPKDAQVSEIKRVLKRQRNDQKKDDLSDDQIKTLADQIVNLATAMDSVMNEAMKKEQKSDASKNKSTALHDEGRRFGLVETLGWLLVMQFLAGKGLDK